MLLMKVITMNLIFFFLLAFVGAQGTLLLQGGKVHSPGSTIQATFKGTILVNSVQVITWKFNDTNVCFIPIPTGDYIAGSYCNSSSDTTYYNNNSAVVSASLSSGVLKAVFSYSNIKTEEYDLMLSITDVVNDIDYGNIATLKTQDCPKQPNATSSDEDCVYYNCTNTFSCKDGFGGDEINATCQQDATWTENITCIAEITTTVITTDFVSETAFNTTSSAGHSSFQSFESQLAFHSRSSENDAFCQPDSTVGVDTYCVEPGTEQRCVCENNEPMYSGERPADSSVIVFSVCLGEEVVSVIIVIWAIGLKKCFIIWVALFYTISFCLIIVGIILTAVYENNCCGNNTERYIGIACGIIGIIGCVVGIILHIIGKLKKAAFLYCCCCRADARDYDESTCSCVCGGKVLCKCGCSKSSGTCYCCCIVTE